MVVAYRPAFASKQTVIRAGMLLAAIASRGRLAIWATGGQPVECTLGRCHSVTDCWAEGLKGLLNRKVNY